MNALGSNYLHMDYEQLCCSAPEDEPQRQLFFIERCKELIEAKRENISGFLQTFHIETYGCQMNAKDSEKLTAILHQMGLLEVDTEEADLVLYNTCTVRENANQKVYGHLGYLSKMKKQNPHKMIALCGCMMQESVVTDKIKKSYPFVDLIFGTHNIFKLAELFCQRLHSRGLVMDIWEGTNQIVEDLPIERKFKFKSGVNIMYGCNNFCSFCIVPYVRGRERSREPEDIIAEIETLVEDGVVEIMLLGQNVNSYGKTLDHPMSFAELLARVEQIEGLERIRFMTSHPKDLSDELIEVMRHSKKVCNHLHLPLQSGSTRLLEIMNRRYTKEHYLELVKKIREAVPDIALTTDIIVGFPGETEEDFQETMDVVEQVRYDSAFTFIYSKRTGTPAATMEGQVPEAVVKERFDRLLTRIQQISAEQSGKDIHTVQKVLVEDINDHKEGYVTGRMTNNVTVHFPGDESLIGTLADVYLAESKGFYYMGRPGTGDHSQS